MQSKKSGKLVKIILGMLVSVVFLWLVFKEIDFNEVWSAMQDLNLFWLIPAILVYFIGVWVRTTRWCFLMRPVKKSTTARFFPIYIISYMANNILPMRIGDIYRAYIVGKKEQVSKSATLVTIGVERIFDGLTMLVLLLLSILLFPVKHEVVGNAVKFGSLLFLSAIMVCYILVLKKSWADAVFKMGLSIVPSKYHEKFQELFDNFFHGLDALKGVHEIIFVILLSLGTWLIEASSFYLVFVAFGFTGSFHIAVATMAMVNLMIIVPASPGYFGPFEYACKVILGSQGYGSVIGFTESTAVAFALVLHVVVQWIPSTLLGLIFMWTEHISFSEIDETSDQDDESKPLVS